MAVNHLSVTNLWLQKGSQYAIYLLHRTLVLASADVCALCQIAGSDPTYAWEQSDSQLR
jgi:hypothetical protein